MAASVWIAPVIGRPLGEVMVRLSALTMPDGDRVGEPEGIADRDHGVADLRRRSSRRTTADAGCRAGASMWITATSVVGSAADQMSRCSVVPVWVITRMLVGAGHHVGVGDDVAGTVDLKAGP